MNNRHFPRYIIEFYSARKAENYSHGSEINGPLIAKYALNITKLEQTDPH